MNHLQRFLVIAICIVSSMVIVQFSNAPTHTPYQGYRVACMLLETAQKQSADKNLVQYAQIAHTTSKQEDPSVPYRCYFRFSPQDIVCTPPSVATRKNLIYCAHFPMIDGSTKNQCYVLNQKLIPLTDNLKKQPPVSLESYVTNQELIVKSWQAVRDILLKPTESEQPQPVDKESL